MFMMNENRKTEIIYLLKYLTKLIDSDFDKRLSEYGLTGQQGRILFFIHRRTKKDGCEIHQTDIENEFHLSKSTVSGLVKRMEKKEIIQIEKQHPYAIIKPARKGEEIIDQLISKKDEAVQKLIKDINQEEKEEILNLLIKMINNMEGDDCACGRKSN